MSDRVLHLFSAGLLIVKRGRRQICHGRNGADIFVHEATCCEVSTTQGTANQARGDCVPGGCVRGLFLMSEPAEPNAVSCQCDAEGHDESCEARARCALSPASCCEEAAGLCCWCHCHIARCACRGAACKGKGGPQCGPMNVEPSYLRLMSRAELERECLELRRRCAILASDAELVAVREQLGMWQRAAMALRAELDERARSRAWQVAGVAPLPCAKASELGRAR